ncbi:uncharacterized protein HMPREF1541_06696 [Cyphellophora europaea CBS 101466]|uniref:Peptidase M16 C-terminal domain-containing protein n=1 Tax=Cyphellophora europaea (strain CBS 101466) TaxID=1220924 RepID=W2RSF4_CYPE1|nr:uncharacterized protein HMPREF1541_06696 [Cyphellophora europaea CBS 101466]ETN38659.1 hypothetical protein HMPREF1541_06696 [Cyphellophora europaea CBS 101466]
MGSIQIDPRFRRIQKFNSTYSPNTVTQYESDRTGMRVVVVDQEGPKLHGFFVLATEIHDDSGAPHTLEHLCFMGSKSYKYKGFLDKLATRAYSNTNAWTATDHTAYTLETAGWAGFAQILPVYLDHLIVPTLTDAGCITEVYHIDGQGNDAGVVYSEMQGVQNAASELMELRGKRLMYPEGVGFRYETGGMMEQLRVLSADRIREFHREMYQPKNLCLLLMGEVDHKELLQILDDFETSVIHDIPPPDKPFSRPWIDSKQATPLTESVVKRVEFPEEDEDFGQIDIKFLGPDIADIVQSGALTVVLLYLCGSPAAVLDNNIVEKEQLASSIYFTVDSRPRTEVDFSMSGVETDVLEDVEKRFHEVLDEAMKKPLDMSFLRDCIDRQIRSTKFNTESQPTHFSDYIIADYLFGKRDGSTLEEMASLDQFERLKSWTEQQWKDFINKYFAKAHYVSLLGVPSAKLSKKLTDDEAARVEKRKKELGPEGLKRKFEELEKAKKENDKEIPPELLAHFRVPSTESIHFVKTSSARAGPALKVGRPDNKYQKIIENDGGEDFPLFINFEHIESNFARIHLMISTENLPVALKPLLAVYFEAFTNLDVQRDGHNVPFDQIVVELERDTVGYTIDSASNLGNVECLRITFQVEISKYSTAIAWINELFWQSIFEDKRLQAINARLLADVPDAKRDGNDMLAAVHIMTHLAPASIGRARSTLVKALYLKRFKWLLKNEPERTASMLEDLRSFLGQFANFRVVVVSDLTKLADPVQAWKPFLSKLDTTQPLAPLGRRIDRLSAAGQNPGALAYVVPMATIDSSFLYAVARGPSTWDDECLPALMVAQAYLNAVEGPLWVAVRGVGLAYGVSTSYDIDSGFVSLDVYRSPDAYKAFEASCKVVQEHIDGTIEFDDLMLEGAISSIVVAMANEQQTLASAAVASFVKEVMRGLPSDYNETLLRKVREVSVDEVKTVMDEVVMPVFKPGKADVMVTCAVGMTEGIQKGLETVGWKPEVHDLTWFQDDYGLKVPDDDDGDDEGDEDEDGDEEDGEADEDASDDFEMVER